MTTTSLFDLSGRVSLVTGAGSGLGRIFSEAMAESGSHVVCADIDGRRAQETAERILRTGVKTLAVRADVSNLEDVRVLFGKVHQEFGRLDILFNNAGLMTRGGRLHEMPLDDWNRVMGVNLTGVFLCMQEGIKLMLRQKKGSIINISSAAGVYGLLPSKSHYGASKAGVISLTKSAAVDYGPDGIRVNAIAPGMIGGTQLGPAAGQTKEEMERLMTKVASETPLRRAGEPAELKGVAVYLASDASSFVTGAVFFVDGGHTA